ncbi:MAG: hypothetical protein GY804_09640 [Alphaproteobacteria bacterium]|nr:hypothetical protein [Alphaproteobacteria bacterium]
MKTVCKHYHIHKWGEPPLEPDENGTIETELQCEIKKGYNLTDCDGDLDLCDQLVNKDEIKQLIDKMIEREIKARDEFDEETASWAIIESGIHRLTELKGKI